MASVESIPFSVSSCRMMVFGEAYPLRRIVLFAATAYLPRLQE
jgi:hypothetical protein